MNYKLSVGAILLITQIGCTAGLESYHEGTVSSEANDFNEVVEFTEATKIIQARCVHCHSSGGTAAVAPMDFSTSFEFVQAGLVVPGDVDASKLIARLKGYVPVTTSQNLGPMNMPADGALSANEIDVLKKWVIQLKNANPPAPTQLFACSDQKATGMTPSQSLTKTQYINALTDVFGSGAVNFASTEISLVPDDSYDALTKQRLSGLTKYHLEAYHRVALKITSYILADNSRITSIFGSCATGSSPDVGCIGYFLNNTAELIFRKKLTTAEKNQMKSVQRSDSDYKEGLRRMLTYSLMAPQFLFVAELGNNNDTQTNFALSGFEIATRIALMATDSIPDRALLDAAENGELADINNVKLHTLRLLTTAHGRAKIKRVLMDWSGNSSVRDTDLLPDDLKNQYSANGLDQEMLTEVDQFIQHTVFDNPGTFTDLLTSKASFAKSATLSKIYGHASGQNQAQMAGRRKGLLMRAPAMSYDNARTGIIHRGVKFQRNVLCNELPEPPAEVFDARDDNALTPQQLLNTANRDSVIHQTKEQACQACHSLINPAGFAFEHIGPFGDIRQDEAIFDQNGDFYRDIAINTKTDVPTFGSKSAAITDAVDLIDHVVSEPEGKACFTRQMFRRLKERKESASDDCQLRDMYAKVSSGSIVDGLVELIASPGNLRKQK